MGRRRCGGIGRLWCSWNSRNCTIVLFQTGSVVCRGSSCTVLELPGLPNGLKFSFFPFTYAFSDLCHYHHWMSALLLHLIQAAAISVYGSLHLFPDFHCSCTIFCRQCLCHQSVFSFSPSVLLVCGLCSNLRILFLFKSNS